MVFVGILIAVTAYFVISIALVIIRLIEYGLFEAEMDRIPRGDRKYYSPPEIFDFWTESVFPLSGEMIFRYICFKKGI